MSGNEFDLLVIGEGLAGISAANAAARHGMRVILASTGPGGFVLGTACIDLHGLTPAQMRPFEPSATQMEEAIASFVEFSALAGCSFEGGLLERRPLPTVMGTFQTVSLAPRSLWKGDPRRVSKVVVAGIDDLSIFDPDFVAERLFFHTQEQGWNTSYRSVSVATLEKRVHALTTVEIATCWDRNRTYRDALIDALRRVVKDAELLIIPGVLGLNLGDDDFEQIEKEIGCTVCELPTVPPSVPGLRLLQRFERRLGALGVEVSTGFSVRSLQFEGERCTGADLDTPGRPRRIHAEAVVLAGGRFSHLLQTGELATGSPRRTIRVDRDLRPIRENGAVIAGNLFECGSVLGTCESRHGNAVAVLTGYQAAMIASKNEVGYAAR